AKRRGPGAYGEATVRLRLPAIGERTAVARGGEPCRPRRARARLRRRHAVAVRPLWCARRSRAGAGTMTAMTRDFRLPDLGEGRTGAEMARVVVGEGDDIHEDAPLLEVETDKAQVEIPSPMSGRVEKIHVQAGQTVKVGQVLVSFGGVPATPAGKTAPTDGRARSAAPPPTARQTQPSVATGRVTEARVTEGPVPAPPATRRLARELGVDLRTVAGSGSGGRVTDDDVRAAASGAKRPAAVPPRVPMAPERHEPSRPAAEHGPAK